MSTASPVGALLAALAANETIVDESSTRTALAELTINDGTILKIDVG